MHSAIDRASTVLAALAALVALGAFAPADAPAQSTKDVVGAVGAVAMAPHMDVSQSTIDGFQNYLFEVNSGGTEVRYPGDAEDCRWAATIVIAFAASRTRSIESNVHCNRHRVLVDVDIGYGGDFQGARIVQRRTSDGAVVWSKDVTP